MAAALVATALVVPGPGSAEPAEPAETVRTAPSTQPSVQPAIQPAIQPVGRAAKGPRLVVDVAKGAHRISPLIYGINFADAGLARDVDCLLYTSPSPRDGLLSRMPSSA